ncbi:NAD(P)-binding domain-containing protein, partial [Salmonella enterica subsp. enterica serovar Istanbul]|nr:NAD(P)-binding domain-containing protein [Salmonella enterica subsp. enterica serovar Istanbul]
MGICTKIGIVGMGHVGAHVANSLVLQGIADELYMTEICSGERDRSKKLAAEVQDLGDSLAFCPHNVALHNCGDDYAQLAQCDVIVNCAGDVSLSS